MRILFLSPWYPYPLDNGSKIRIYHVLRSLAHKHEVFLLSFVRDREHVDRSGLNGLCSSIQTVPWREFVPRRLKSLVGFLASVPRSVVDTYSPEIDNLIREAIRQRQPNAIIASEMGTARYAHGHSDIPRVLDEIQVGVIHDTWAQAPSLAQRWRHGLTWTKTRRYVGRLVHDFDACTVASEKEWMLLRKTAPDYEAVHIIPNGVDLVSLRPGLAEPQSNTLIYNGALTYSANFDAMRYFLEAIFPQVRVQMPEVRLQITGSTQGVDTTALDMDNHVTLTGYLPDIRPAVAGAWACVVPLRVGGGTRVKILEAMALGTPVIATSKGAEGLDVTSGQDILIADTSAEFAAQIVRLLRDPALRSCLVHNGRQLVEARYSWEIIGQKFEQLVEDVVRARTTR